MLSSACPRSVVMLPGVGFERVRALRLDVEAAAWLSLPLPLAL